MKANTLLRPFNICLKQDFEITSLEIDSRKVSKGSVFLCLVNNHLVTDYVQQAIEKKASLILIDAKSINLNKSKLVEHSSIVKVMGLSHQLVPIIHSFFENSHNCFQARVGITGTNGKTTTATLIANLLKSNFKGVVSLGTNGYQVGNKKFPSSLTTPSLVDLYRYLYLGYEQGCDALVMETSSHALHQDRMVGLTYTHAIFTNLTQDHLDYHSNFEDYYSAKKKLFTDYLQSTGVAIINYDDPYGFRLLKEVTQKKYSFSVKNNPNATVRLLNAKMSLQGIQCQVVVDNQKYVFYSKLLGSVNLENLLAVISFGFSLGISYQKIFDSVKETTVAGRNECVDLPNKAIAVIDYAHTPDALSRVMIGLKTMVKGNIIVVMGCGGDRDKDKRAIMGKISTQLADIVYVTNDNPRTEDPQIIVNDILKGCIDKDKIVIELDRKTAIEMALSQSQRDDCVLIAGKGHEDYQIIGTKTIFFDDKKVVQQWKKQYN